jgi:hypothetical protein
MVAADALTAIANKSVLTPLAGRFIVGSSNGNLNTSEARKFCDAVTGVGQFETEAIQTREFCVARIVTLRTPGSGVSVFLHSYESGSMGSRPIFFAS